MKSLAESLVLHGTVKTTTAKAKALRTFIEPLVTKAKGSASEITRRRVLKAALFTDAVVEKLIKELGPKYQTRAGGYTRITKVGTRWNDASEISVIEFV